MELADHELASSLSFLFLNSIPDAELRAAADDGSLANAAIFKAQVERLLKLPRVQENLTTVMPEVDGLGLGLGGAELATQEKEFVPELKASVEEETRLLFQELLGKGGTVERHAHLERGLRRSGAGHPPGRDGAGAPASAGHLPGQRRSGMLTLNGVIARYSLSRPEVFRGKYVRDEVLCEEIPPPPPERLYRDRREGVGEPAGRVQAEVRLITTCGACHSRWIRWACRSQTSMRSAATRPTRPAVADRLRRRTDRRGRCRRPGEGRGRARQPAGEQREGRAGVSRARCSATRSGFSPDQTSLSTPARCRRSTGSSPRAAASCPT